MVLLAASCVPAYTEPMSDDDDDDDEPDAMEGEDDEPDAAESDAEEAEPDAAPQVDAAPAIDAMVVSTCGPADCDVDGDDCSCQWSCEGTTYIVNCVDTDDEPMCTCASMGGVMSAMPCESDMPAVGNYCAMAGCCVGFPLPGM